LSSFDLDAHARSDAAMAAFTLTSTTHSNDPGTKIQATGANFGLVQKLHQYTRKSNDSYTKSHAADIKLRLLAILKNNQV